MFCIRCNQELGDCTCPDIDERLVRAANHPSIALTFCAKCQKHEARCLCPEGPSRSIVSGNSECNGRDPEEI